MQASVTPSILTATVTDGGVSTLTFPRRMGSVLIDNLGSNEVFITWDGVDPVGSFGDGRYELPAGQSLFIPYTDVLTVKAICATGETTRLQATGTPSANSGGEKN